MKKAIFLLSVLIVFLLVAPPDPADVQAAAPQDVMAGHWVLKFEDGRTGWANLVSDDYAKTSFSSKGKIEVPGFKKVDLTSGVIPGTASCFTRKFGRKKLWMTSFERSRMRTARPEGTVISFSVTMSSLPSGSVRSNPSEFVVSSISRGSVRPNFPSGPG